MTFHETVVDFNNKYAASFDKGDLPLPPSKKLVIVTCVDARVEPASQLGINLGEAHIIRNAGGMAKDALRSIVISQRLLGTSEIAVFHHTDCGMLTFTNDVIRDKVKAEHAGNAEIASAVDSIDFLPFPHLEQSVKDDVKFLQGNPLVLESSTITGWVYDVKTGKVHKVV